VDKMHFKGYAEQWCRLHCSSNDFDELEKVYPIFTCMPSTNCLSFTFWTG